MNYQNIQNELNDFLKLKDKNFMLIDLINIENKYIVDKLEISKESSFFYSSEFNNNKSLYYNIYNFLSNIGNNNEDINIITTIIIEIVENICKLFNTNIFTLRMKSSLKCEQLNWHIDGSDNISTRFCLTLKGKSTLISILDDESHQKFVNLENEQMLDFEKRTLDRDLDFITDYETKNKIFDNIDILTKEQYSLQKNKLINNIIEIDKLLGLIFFKGYNDISLIHSEPIFNEQRLFLSIDPL